MKIQLLILFSIFALIFTSCTKDEDVAFFIPKNGPDTLGIVNQGGISANKIDSIDLRQFIIGDSIYTITNGNCNYKNEGIEYKSAVVINNVKRYDITIGLKKGRIDSIFNYALSPLKNNGTAYIYFTENINGTFEVFDVIGGTLNITYNNRATDTLQFEFSNLIAKSNSGKTRTVSGITFCNSEFDGLVIPTASNTTSTTGTTTTGGSTVGTTTSSTTSTAGSTSTSTTSTTITVGTTTGTTSTTETTISSSTSGGSTSTTETTASSSTSGTTSTTETTTNGTTAEGPGSVPNNSTIDPKTTDLYFKANSSDGRNENYNLHKEGGSLVQNGIQLSAFMKGAGGFFYPQGTIKIGGINGGDEFSESDLLALKGQTITNCDEQNSSQLFVSPSYWISEDDFRMGNNDISSCSVFIEDIVYRGKSISLFPTDKHEYIIKGTFTIQNIGATIGTIENTTGEFQLAFTTLYKSGQ